MGLPLVLRTTCSKLMNELKEADLGGYSLERYCDKLFDNINDSVYREFIKNCSKFYFEREVKKIARNSFVLCYEVLKREGELPKLDKRKIKKWENNINKDYSTIIYNVKSNRDKVCDDNPIYGEFIILFADHFPESKNLDNLENIIKSGAHSDRLFILSDLLSGYMLLADSVK